MNEKINTKNAPAAIGPYSQAIKAGDFLFVSGQIPVNPKTNEIVSSDIKEQTKQVLENLKAIVSAAGMKLENVVKCTCFLKSMDDFVVFNSVYSEYFASSLPARECVAVVKLPKDVLVEISAICAKT